MPATARGSRDEPRLFQTIRNDFRDVTGHPRRQTQAVSRTFEELEEFYLTPAHRERLAGMKPVARWIHRIPWFFKSLFLKLTPTRRVLVVLAVFLFLWSFNIDVRDVSVHFETPLLGVALLVLVLALELKDKLVARDELEAGRSVQRALMSGPVPTVPGWEVWLWTRPANDVGGDLVDCMRLEADRFGLVLADVAGKGLPAALLMAKVQATVRALAPDFERLDDLGARVNRILCRDGLPDRFATLVYLEIGAGSGRVRVLNAGHMPPYVLRGRAVEEMPRGGVAMGIVKGASFDEQDVELSPGDVLLVYSDGVTEAMNKAGDFFGDERLRALLPGLASLPTAEAGARVFAAVDAFVGDSRPHDDISLILLKRASQ
jgi:serine phosphatase RsbU (regulator of sigma subunit)